MANKFKFATHHKIGFVVLSLGILVGTSSAFLPSPVASYVAIAGIALIIAGLWLIFPSSFTL
jgi:hypothetical protein